VNNRQQTDALWGSIDLLILKTLSLAPMHGWGVGQRIQQISQGALDVNQGSLYPALQRLEKAGSVSYAPHACWCGSSLPRT
jgi:DNA-binding PadR family transcriptional regulator